MYKSLADAIRDAEEKKISLSRLALETESRDQGRPVAEIRAALQRALDVMRGAVAQGMTGDMDSSSGLGGGDAAKLSWRIFQTIFAPRELRREANICR